MAAGEFDIKPDKLIGASLGSRRGARSLPLSRGPCRRAERTPTGRGCSRWRR